MNVSSEALQKARAMAERQLTAEEFAAGLAVPISDEERAEILTLVSWFCRRYPTPAERLAYVRRAQARWKGTSPSPTDLDAWLAPRSPTS